MCCGINEHILGSMTPVVILKYCVIKQVLHVEQQIVKRRVKRDFSLPTDPLWNAEWYLVRQTLSNK